MSEIQGKLLAEGFYRWVYECASDPRWVVKVDKTAEERLPHRRHQTCGNREEYEAYLEICGAGLAKYVPECYFKDGYLFMRKTEPLPPGVKYVRMPPVFRKDNKRVNWGVLDGRIVRIDLKWFIRENVGKPPGKIRITSGKSAVKEMRKG